MASPAQVAPATRILALGVALLVGQVMAERRALARGRLYGLVDSRNPSARFHDARPHREAGLDVG
jgi:hypothetical protein